MKIDQVFNNKFTADEAEQQLRKLLHQWWYLNSHAGLALSRSDLFEVMSARDKAVSLVVRMFDRLLEEADVRRSNFGDFSDWKFVSLGEDCFSRSLTTRWGFKRSAALGEKSRPFDLAVHPPAALRSLIESDFEGYLESENLTYNEKVNYCFNKKYGIGFNHEVGKEYADDDFRKLKEVYSKRLERFRDDLRQAAKTCFVLHLENPGERKWSDAKCLIDALLQKVRSEDMVLICISTFKYGEPINIAGRSEFERDGVYFIEENYPLERYVWHVTNRTDEGKVFERRVADRMSRILKAHIHARA